MSPLISVVVPTYNHAHLINKCLQSLIDQSYSNWEALVINNFSSDNTVEVIESFSDARIRIINFHNNGVIAAARNEGIQNSSGDWIAFLDSDDWWYPSKLSEIIPLLNDNDIIFHNLDVYTSSGKSFRTIKGRHHQFPIFEDLLVKGNQILNSSVVIRNNIIEEACYLSEDPDLFALEDFDLWLRVSKLTERFYYLNRALGAYWQGNTNCSNASRKSIERMKHLYANHLPSISQKSQKSALAILNYILTRERMLCGDRYLLFEFLKTLHHLKRRKFILNSIIFGFLSILKSKTGVNSQ
jgi:glycosyltransferase involved in cell wall biosynthesis